MRKYIFMFVLLTSVFSYSEEIIPEDFILEKAIPFFEIAKSYKTNDKVNHLTEVKAMRVPKGLLRELRLQSTPITFIDSNGKVVDVTIDDFLVTPSSYSRIYVVPKNDFLKNYSAN